MKKCYDNFRPPSTMQAAFLGFRRACQHHWTHSRRLTLSTSSYEYMLFGL